MLAKPYFSSCIFVLLSHLFYSSSQFLPSGPSASSSQLMEDEFGFYRTTVRQIPIYRICKNYRFTPDENCRRSSVKSRNALAFSPTSFSSRIRKIGRYEIEGTLKESRESYSSQGTHYTSNERCPLENFDSSEYIPRFKRGVEITKAIIFQNEDEDFNYNAQRINSFGIPSSEYQSEFLYPSTKDNEHSNSDSSSFKQLNNEALSPFAAYPYPNSHCEGRSDICTWEAILICDIKGPESNVRWTRVYDHYYSLGQYSDILDYFGSRARIDILDDGTSRLIIYKVFPEDKGIYVCESFNIYGALQGFRNYIYHERNREILEISFFPTFPLDPRLC